MKCLHRGRSREYRGSRAVCHSTAEKREVPREGNCRPQSYEVELLTLQVSIAALVGSRAAVVPRRCADCAGMWCMAEPVMGSYFLVGNS